MHRSSPFVLGIAALTLTVGGTALQADTFADGFADGKTALDWQSHPLFDGEPLQAATVDDAPDGDGGVGVLAHEGGGLATISYAETVRAEDVFAVEAWVDCPIEPEGRDGTLTGIAFFIQLAKEGQDPEKSGFYRLVCAYRGGIGALALAYVGPNIGQMPLELERWELLAQAPPPGDGSWRKVRVEVELGLMEIYLDDVRLNQDPLPVEQVITDIANLNAGYAGIYAGHIGEAGTAEARVDGFRYEVP